MLLIDIICLKNILKTSVKLLGYYKLITKKIL